MNQCYTSSFTCIDCSRHFDSSSVHGHTQCVTEHDKYAKGATKPGGFAEKGFYDDGSAGKTNGHASSDGGGGSTIVGEEFLSRRAPWVCSVCHVTCTSQQTLASHASGTKHVRRVRARLRDQETNGQNASHDGNVSLPDGEKHTQKNEETKTRGDKKGKKKEMKKALKQLVKKELEKHRGGMKKKKLFKTLEDFLEKHQCSKEKAEKYLLKHNDTFAMEGKFMKLS